MEEEPIRHDSSVHKSSVAPGQPGLGVPIAARPVKASVRRLDKPLNSSKSFFVIIYIQAHSLVVYTKPKLRV